MGCVISIDICNSTLLKEGMHRGEADQLIQDFHLVGQESFTNPGVWGCVGDAIIALERELEPGITSAIGFLKRLQGLNKTRSEQLLKHSPVFTRIGIESLCADDWAALSQVEHAQRGKVNSGAIDRASHHQKRCPIGSIAVSAEAFHSLTGPFKEMFRPASLAEAFILKTRLLQPQEEFRAEHLTDAQKQAVPPLCFTDWKRLQPELTLRDIRSVLRKETVAILGETRESKMGPMAPAASSDAVGVMEALAAGPPCNLSVGIDEWQSTADSVAERNVLLIGSGTVNLYAYLIGDLALPIRFAKANGQVLDQIVVTDSVFVGDHGTLSRNCGFVLISRSPFNLERHLIWVAGISGMGTQAASALFKQLVADDIPVALQRSDAIGCVVEAAPAKGSDRGLREYFKKWRISEFDVRYVVDRHLGLTDARA